MPRFTNRIANQCFIQTSAMQPQSSWIIGSLLVSTLIFAACGNPAGLSFEPTGNGIVNGQDIGGRASSKKEPLAKSVVALVAQNTDAESLCTGTVLAPDLILTAAHCVEHDPQLMKVVFGADLTTANNSSRVVDRFMQHPDWGHASENGRGDIAVVHFLGGLPPGFIPVTLADEKIDLELGTQVLMIGYGVTDGIANTGAGVLRETQTTVMSKMSPTEVVTDGRKSSVCFGDSGGPAFSQEDGEWVQWGVASSVTDQACNQSSVHTAIMTFVPWIKAAAAKLRQTN